MTDILEHRQDGVLTLTFNRVARKNSITIAMYEQLATVLVRAAHETETRVVVLRGHETVFSAGNDLEDFLHHPPTGKDAPAFRFLRSLAICPKPVLAAVCGPAVGVGTTMLFHCDLVYAGDNAAFSMPFVNLGVCPEAASSLLAPHILGMRRATEALLLGEPFYAEAALEAGLVNRIVTPDACNALVQAQALKLAAKPLSSLMVIKWLLKSPQQEAVLRRIDEEGEQFSRMLAQPAAREAMTAFMEKRKPDFSKY